MLNSDYLIFGVVAIVVCISFVVAVYIHSSTKVKIHKSYYTEGFKAKLAKDLAERSPSSQD